MARLIFLVLESFRTGARHLCRFNLRRFQAHRPSRTTEECPPSSELKFAFHWHAAFNPSPTPPQTCRCRRIPPAKAIAGRFQFARDSPDEPKSRASNPETGK